MELDGTYWMQDWVLEDEDVELRSTLQDQGDIVTDVQTFIGTSMSSLTWLGTIDRDHKTTTAIVLGKDVLLDTGAA